MPILITFLPKLIEWIKSLFRPKNGTGSFFEKLKISYDLPPVEIDLGIPRIYQRDLKHPAFHWACDFTCLVMLLGYKQGHPIDLNLAFNKCVNSGAITEADAYINNFDKVSATLGQPALRYRSQKFDPNKLRTLLLEKNPVVIFFCDRATRKLAHVELSAKLQIYQKAPSAPTETLFGLLDPGWAEHTHMGNDGIPFHLEANGNRITNNRQAYWMGWYA